MSFTNEEIANQLADYLARQGVVVQHFKRGLVEQPTAALLVTASFQSQTMRVRPSTSPALPARSMMQASSRISTYQALAPIR
jgi:hypothetical protein